MIYTEFVRISDQISRWMASNKFKEAEDELFNLIMSDVSDIDKVKMCIQMAIIRDRIGNSDEALGWFDKGISYEQPYFRYQASVEKARYLADLGKCMEAVPIYEDLVKQTYVSEAEKEDFRKEIKTLLSRAIGQWG